jgi:parvulin-like peptidyl-prolyl isomerase
VKRSIVLLLVFLAGAVPARSAEVVERILAVVNDEVVTEQDLEIVMAPVMAQYRTMFTGSEYDAKAAEARKEFLSKVIDDKLILGEAKRKQVIVKEDEVDAMMADVRNKFPNREAFLGALGEQGMTEKKLWDRFRDQIMTQKLVSYEVKSKVSVSPGEVNEYYKANESEFKQGDQVKLQHILVRSSTREEEEAKELAEGYVAEIKAGRPFEEIAKAKSEGSEASEGGDMGWVEKGQLMGEIDDKVFALQAGEMTGPIQSQLGFHIFKVIDRKQVSIKPLSDVRNQIQDTLFKKKLSERLDTWMKDLKKSAYISIR